VQNHPGTLKCNLCPKRCLCLKRITRTNNLRSHRRTQREERPFVYTGCVNAFALQRRIPTAMVLGRHEVVAFAHSPYPNFELCGSYALSRGSKLQPTHSPHDDKVHSKAPLTTPIKQSNQPNTATDIHPDSPWGFTNTGKAPLTTPIKQSNQPKTATDIHPDSPWGFTKAGKARKRLEQACVSCREKKIKCKLTSSSTRCLPCERSGSECYFDNM